MLANAYGYETDAESIVVRLFNTVGPRQSGSYGMVLPRLVQQALDGRDPDRLRRRHPDQVLRPRRRCGRSNLLLLDTEEAVGKTFNIGSPNEISIRELAARIVERTGSSSEISLIPYEEAYGAGFEEIGRRHPDLGLIHGITGWSPIRNIDDMIDDVIADQHTHVA